MSALDDEREALADLIAEERDKWPRRADDMDSEELAATILAAGFRRQGPITDAQVEAATEARDLYESDDSLSAWDNRLAETRAALEAARGT